MRRYSLNPFRWLKWFYLRLKYRNSKWINFFAPMPETKKYLMGEFEKFFSVENFEKILNNVRRNSGG